VIIACHAIGIAKFKSKFRVMLTILGLQVIPNLFLEIIELDTKVMFDIFLIGLSWEDDLGRKTEMYGFHRYHIVIHLIKGQTHEVMHESCCC